MVTQSSTSSAKIMQIFILVKLKRLKGVKYREMKIHLKMKQISDQNMEVELLDIKLLIQIKSKTVNI